jgi:hypothetical protein
MLTVSLTLLTVVMLATPLVGSVQAHRWCKPPKTEDFVWHVENAIATDIIDPIVFPRGAEIGSPDARYVLYYREFNLDPAYENYVEIGTTQTPIAPEDYECKYTVFWTYDDPVLGTGTGKYTVFEKITLPNGYITMISKETATFDGAVFSAEGTFIGYGKIGGQRVLLKGERHGSIELIPDPPYVISTIENIGTIRYR